MAKYVCGLHIWFNFGMVAKTPLNLNRFPSVTTVVKYSMCYNNSGLSLSEINRKCQVQIYEDSLL